MRLLLLLGIFLPLFSSEMNVKNRYMQLKFYEPWYVLPAYYSASKTYDDKLTRFEIKAQVSFRVDILDNVMCEYCAFGFGFTNVIYLQTYNPDESSPLRDIDLSPSISFDYKKTIPIKDGEWGYINWLSFGYLHTSNGEREDINPRDPRQSAWGGNFVRSKSLDRIFVEVGYSYMDLNIRFRAWIKQALAAFDGDRTNGDIADYIGYGDIKISYKYKNNLFELYLNNILNNYFSKKYWNWKGKVELGYSYAITDKFAIYLQYLYGHGDSLYEYSLPVNRIGIGIRL